MIDAEEFLQQIERQILLIVRSQTNEFLKLHLDKTETSVLLYYPLRQQEINGATVYSQLIALGPKVFIEYADEINAILEYPHTVITYSIQNFDPTKHG